MLTNTVVKSYTDTEIWEKGLVIVDDCVLTRELYDTLIDLGILPRDK